MKKILVGLGVIAGLLLIAAVAVPLLVPMDTYKEQITTQVEEATGRRLNIDGDIRLSILSGLGIEVNKVRFQNVRGGATPEMMQLEALRIKVAVIPLLTGDIEIDQFVLVNPVINLETDRSGRGNWEFTPGKKAAPAAPSTKPSQPAQPAAPSQQALPPPKPSSAGGGGAAKDGASPGIKSVRLGDVRLVDGLITFRDGATGTTEKVSGINMKLSLPDFEQPFKAHGSLVWKEEKISLDTSVSSLRNLMEGRTTRIEAKVDVRTVTLMFGGSVKNAGTLVASGNVDLNVPSIRGLAAWVGQPIEGDAKGFGPLSIKGSVGVAGPKYSFTRATMRLDNMNGKGDFRVDLSGKRPSVWARMEFDKIDLNNYIGAGDAADAAAGGSGEVTADGGAPAGSGTSSSIAGGSGAPATASEGWSDERIDLTALRMADARLSLQVGGIFVQQIKVGKTALTVSLRRGRLVADLKEMLLYGGKGSARISVNVAGSQPTIENALRLSGFQAQPFLKDAANFDRVEGTADAAWSIATTGTSERQLVSALRGRGNMRFANGAVRGINLGALISNTKSAFGDASRQNMQKTDFAELTGSFTIASGIVRNSDLILKSPHLRVSGQGSANMPQRTVNYVVTPKVVKSSQGQGGQADTSGLAVPVKIYGPWDNLSYKPDVKGTVRNLAKDPKVREAVEELKKKKAKDAKRALRRLFR